MRLSTKLVIALLLASPAALRAGYAENHAAVVDWVAREARPGDTVLIMGARDPDLPALARAVYAALL